MNLYKANVTVKATYRDATYADTLEEATTRFNNAALELAGDLDCMTAEVSVEVTSGERVEDGI